MTGAEITEAESIGIGEIHVAKVRSHFWPRWWRNPIRWWKLRHLRHDLKIGDTEMTLLDVEVRDEFERRLDAQMLFGTAVGVDWGFDEPIVWLWPERAPEPPYNWRGIRGWTP